MNVFHSLTRRSLAKNKMRTLVTVIGIILSTAMFTAVTTLISSAREYMITNTIATNGDWHGVYYSAPDSAVSELEATGEVKSGNTIRAQVLGYAEIEGNKNIYKPYFQVLGAEGNFFNEMKVQLTDGRLPEDTSELLVPMHLSQSGGIKLEIGETITLALGDRISDETGLPLLQTNSITLDAKNRPLESLDIRESRTYTVVGHYARPAWENYSAPGYTALTIADKNPNGYFFDTYFRLNNPGKTFDFMNGHRFGMDWGTNSDLLMMLGASAYNGFYTFLYGFAAILIALIMFGSISLIYNAFSISVSERTKQFGLLSSIGATRKQLRSSIRYEAFLVSLVGIPLGILSGLLGIGITLYCIGDMFAGIFTGASGVPLTLSVSPVAIIAATVIALITISISVRIPARRAMKVTAIEAIRQTQDVNIKARKVKTSKLTWKLSGLEGTLASKNFKRSKKSYRATVISLFMSVVLFISASSFCFYLTYSVEGAASTVNFDLHYYYPTSALDEIKYSPQQVGNMLSSVSGVSDMIAYQQISAVYPVAVDEMSGELYDMYEEYANGDSSLSTFIYVVDDSSYEAYLEENHLSKSIYMDPENPVFIATQTLSYLSGTSTVRNHNIFKNDNPRSVDLTLMNFDKSRNYDGNIEGLSSDESKALFYDDATLEIGLFTDRLVYSASEYVGYGLCMMISERCADAAFGGYEKYMDGDFYYSFKTADHKAAYDKMIAKLDESGLDAYRLYDYAENEEIMRNLVTVINVLSYGFIILISLIAIANVFNTISTNIALRRREFAMLKSVGMTRGGFNRMMNYECLLYGVKSLLYGLPVSIAITYLIFSTASGSYEQRFVMPMTSVVVAVLSVFIVVFVTMMYSMRKIKKDNPIDALKLETL